MYGYIYKTTNVNNGKFYVGKHKSSCFDPTYLGSGNYISAAIKKYGKESFINEMIDTADSLYELNEKEKYWISELNARKLGYNIAPGGDGGEVWGDPSNHPSLGKPGLRGDANPMYKMLKEHPELKDRLSCDMRNRRHVISPKGERKFVRLEELQRYLDEGWICPRLESEIKAKEKADRLAALGKKRDHNGRPKGVYHHSESTKDKMREAHKKLVSDPGYRARLSKQIKKALSMRSEEQKQAFSNMRRRIQTGKHPSAESNKKRSESMKKLYENGFVSPRKGKPSWNKGLKMTKEQCAELSKIAKGRIHITDGKINKMIYPEDFDRWAELGFYKGRTMKNKSTVD